MAAYIVADIEIVDREAFAEYRAKVPAVIAAFGGRYLARGGVSETREGDWRPGRLVVVEFPDLPTLRRFLDSAEYAPLRALRLRAARTNLVTVEGV